MTLPFENDTGPVIKKLASRSIQTDKRRNLFVIVTIALAAALMAAIFCAGAGSDRKLEADIRGQYQAVVVNCDRDTIERLKDCPEVERWGLSQNYGSARYGDSVLTVEYADANWMELGKKPSFTGTLPQAANEILVERAFLDYFEIPAEVGQTIEVNLGNGKQTYTGYAHPDVFQSLRKESRHPHSGCVGRAIKERKLKKRGQVQKWHLASPIFMSERSFQHE